jgi:hypothetical protein
LKVPFTGEQYESVHQAMMALMDELEHVEYHGAKFKTFLRKIATFVDLFLYLHFIDFNF